MVRAAGARRGEVLFIGPGLSKYHYCAFFKFNNYIFFIFLEKRINNYTNYSSVLFSFILLLLAPDFPSTILPQFVSRQFKFYKLKKILSFNQRM